MDIDGYNQFQSLFRGGASARDEILLQLDPPASYYGVDFIGQAALRFQDWKLILGQVRPLPLLAAESYPF